MMSRKEIAARYRAANLEACRERVRIASARWRRSPDGQAAQARYRQKEKAAGWPRAAKWRAAHRHQASAMTKRWQAEHPAAVAEIRARKLARKRAATMGDTRAVRAVYLRARSVEPIECHWCGVETHKGGRQVDHAIPLSRGGAHTAANLVIACAACNRRKYNKMPAEFAAAV